MLTHKNMMKEKSYHPYVYTNRRTYYKPQLLCVDTETPALCIGITASENLVYAIHSGTITILFFNQEIKFEIKLMNPKKIMKLFFRHHNFSKNIPEFFNLSTRNFSLSKTLRKKIERTFWCIKWSKNDDTPWLPTKTK